MDIWDLDSGLRSEERITIKMTASSRGSRAAASLIREFSCHWIQLEVVELN